MNAVCGMELRIPKPLTPAGFNEFNQGYLKHLAGWDVQVDGNNPIARTNVAIAIAPVAEPALFGFYYTMPATTPVAHLRARGRGRSEIDERRQDGDRRGRRCIGIRPHAENQIRAGPPRRASRRNEDDVGRCHRGESLHRPQCLSGVRIDHPARRSESRRSAESPGNTRARPSMRCISRSTRTRRCGKS